LLSHFLNKEEASTRTMLRSLAITSRTLRSSPSTALLPKNLINLARYLSTNSELNVVGGDGKNRVLILGTGWGGFNLALNMKNDQAPSDTVPEVRVVSPSNHFVFTPLLPSTAVGTLEFRAIQEPIRKVLGKNGNFVQAKAIALDPDEKSLVCTSTHDDEKFKIKYDKLVIAVGVKTNTFGIDR
jgi:hypothetical protein